MTEMLSENKGKNEKKMQACQQMTKEREVII